MQSPRAACDISEAMTRQGRGGCLDELDTIYSGQQTLMNVTLWALYVRQRTWASANRRQSLIRSELTEPLETEQSACS
jgi:hypothetical protein